MIKKNMNNDLIDFYKGTWCLNLLFKYVYVY